MRHVLRLSVAGLVSVWLVVAIQSQEVRRLPVWELDATAEKPWEEVARKNGLGDKDIEMLRRNKFVIAGKSHKQIFEPYLGGDVPAFVTTDSLLNGFHVLFEESISRLEKVQAQKLPGILQNIALEFEWNSGLVKGDRALLTGAHKRAALVLGTARQLLDARALPKDQELRSLIEEEAARVVAGKETRKPVWLGLRMTASSPSITRAFYRAAFTRRRRSSSAISVAMQRSFF